MMKVEDVFPIGEQEQALLQLAYFQALMAKAMLYYGTDKGRLPFVPLPALIAAAIVESMMEHAAGLSDYYVFASAATGGKRFPASALREGFWWDNDTIHRCEKAVRALKKMPENIQCIALCMLNEHSIFHPSNRSGLSIGAAWPVRPVGMRQSNFEAKLSAENIAEVKTMVLPRLGEQLGGYCLTVGSFLEDHLSRLRSIVRQEYAQQSVML